jgi:hypothetical protein
MPSPASAPISHPLALALASADELAVRRDVETMERRFRLVREEVVVQRRLAAQQFDEALEMQAIAAEMLRTAAQRRQRRHLARVSAEADLPGRRARPRP